MIVVTREDHVSTRPDADPQPPTANAPPIRDRCDDGGERVRQQETFELDRIEQALKCC